MNQVARVIAKIALEYVEASDEAGSETRLLLPGLTDAIAREVHSALSKRKKRSFLVVPSDADTPPDEERGLILADGLTSVREGEMLMVALPGQISRIQDSIIGTGGTVRSQAFSDEWPWVLDGENPSFSFSKAFLPELMKVWDVPDGCQSWLSSFISHTIVPSSAGELRKGEFVLDELLGKFRTTSGMGESSGGSGSILEFLRHCGLPKPPDSDALVGPSAEKYSGMLLTLTRAVADALEKGISRVSVKERAAEMADGNPKQEELLKAATDDVFDSLGERGHIATSLFLFKSCFENRPNRWEQLDMDVLSKLFRGTGIDDGLGIGRIEIGLGEGEPGRIVSGRRASNVYSVHGCKLHIRVQLDRKPDVPTDLKVLLRGRELGASMFSGDSLEGSLSIDTGAISAYSRQIPAKVVVRRRDAIAGDIATHILRLDLVGEMRPLFGLLLDSQETIDVVDSGEDDSLFPRIDVDEPQSVEILCFDSSRDLNVNVDDTQVALEQIGETPGHFALSRPIDPAAALAAASLLKIEQGRHVVAAYVGMEEVKRGQFTIEEELRELLFSGQNRMRLEQVLSIFHGSDALAYPHLGDIEGSTRTRVTVAREVLENPDLGGFPILVDISQKQPDLSGVSRGNFIVRREDDEIAQNFDPNSLIPTTEELVETYRTARKKLLGEIRRRHRGEGPHPLYAASPTYFKDRSVELALCAYLDAYELCLKCLKKEEKLRNKNDKFILSWLDCVVCVDRDENVPIILVGPWHPLVLSQRYMVQACLCDAATRFSKGQLGSKYHRLAPLLADVVGCRWMPFAAPQNPMSMGAFNVSATSDPGWLMAISTMFVDDEVRKELLEKLEEALGLTVANVSTVETRDIEGYLRDFLKAYPSRRSISMRVATNYLPDTFMRAARNLTQSHERDFGQRLPGGLHFVFAEEPKELDGFEWQEPPLLAYHVKDDEKINLKRNPVDIHLLQGGKLAKFEATESVKAPPRGDGLHAVFYEPLQELNLAARTFNTSLHESGVDGEEDKSELGGRYRKILDTLDWVQTGKYLTTMRPGRSSFRCPWVVTPAQYVDPAAMTALVAMEDKGRADNFVLWDYKLEISGSHGGYFTLSQVNKELEKILSGNELLVEGESAQDIVVELGKVGIALASEVVRSNTTAQGALGIVGALRLFRGTGESPGVLKNGDRLVSFFLPVDSFEEVFKTLGGSEAESAKRTDLLAIQLAISPEESSVLIVFLGIEAKYVTSTLGRDRAIDAIEQAKETVTRITELAKRGRTHGLERQAFVRLIAHGLRLSAPSRGHDVRVDSQILCAILRGNYDVVDVSPNTFVVSSEVGFSGKAKIVMDPSAWIRLSPGHWPSPHTKPSSDLTRVIEQLEVFSARMMESTFEVKSSKRMEEKLVDTKIDPSVPEQLVRVNAGEQDGGVDGPVSHGELTEAEFESAEIQDTSFDKTIEDANGVKVAVGIGTEWPRIGESVFFHPSNTELTQLNIGIVGDLGTGKTQKIQGLVRDITDQTALNRGKPAKFLIFDYKGDYVGPDFVERTGAKVVPPRDIPLNILDPSEAGGINAELDRTNFLIDVFRKIYGGIGPTQEYSLRKVIRDCYDNCRSLATLPSIYDICARYQETLKAPDSVLSILSNLTLYKIFERDLSRVMKFSDFFSGVTVIDLKSLGTWDQGKNMLVVMFLNFFYDYMLRIEKQPFIGSDPQLRAIDSFLLVDEADQIMKYQFPVLRRILLQGREFGIGVILASQYLSHFKQEKENYSEPLLTWILHRVPNISVKDLVAIGLTGSEIETVNKIKNLKSHHSFYKTSIGEACFMKNVTFFE